MRMREDRFDKLTERQKECLRCVSRGLEVKETARELGISPSAVVERLRAARRALDVETSREAARLLAFHERPETNTRHVNMPQSLADIPYPLPPVAGSEDGATAGEQVRLQEVSTPFAAVGPYFVTSQQLSPMPWRARGTRSNDLTLSERIVASGALTIATTIAVAIILIAVLELMTFLMQISRHGG